MTQPTDDVLGTCDIESCEMDRFCRGWCKTHYRRWLKFGDPETPVQPRVRGGRPVKTSHGYMRVFRPGHPKAGQDGMVLEHIMVVYDAGIPIPSGHDVHHLNHDHSDNRLENLEVVSHAVHARRHAQERAEGQTRCARGHELTAENTYVRPNGVHRECRECRREDRQRRNRAAQAA